MFGLVLGLCHFLLAAGNAVLGVVIVEALSTKAGSGGVYEMVLLGVAVGLPVVGDLLAGLGLVAVSRFVQQGGAHSVLLLALLVAACVDFVRAPMMMFFGLGCLTLPLYLAFAVAELVGALWVAVAERPIS